MKKSMMVALAALLLVSPMAAQARRHKHTTPDAPKASPSAKPTPSPTPQASETHSLNMDASLMASFETKNDDGDARRDAIVLIENLATNSKLASVPISYKSFFLKDARTGRTYSAVDTNLSDLQQNTTVAASDGVWPNFKLYFDIPGDLRPSTLYVKVGDTLESYPLEH